MFNQKWNTNEFAEIDSQETSILKIVYNLKNRFNEVYQKVFNELETKTDLLGDHKGSWQGLNKPTLSEEGMRATVEKIINEDIPNIHTSIKETVKQMDSISVNLAYYRTDITDMSERLTHLIENTNRDIFLNVILSEDIELSNTVHLRKNICINGNNHKITTGNINAFHVYEPNTNTQYSVVSQDNNKFTLATATSNLSVGDKVCVHSSESGKNPITLYSIISAINGTEITLADNGGFNILGTGKFMVKTVTTNTSIKNCKFTKNFEIDKNSKADIYIQGSYQELITIDNCIFENTSGVAITRVDKARLSNSIFINTGDSCLLYDTCNCEIINNKFTNFIHAIRCAYTYKALISGNNVLNGRDKRYSVGIEISGVTTDCNKSCYCKIVNNSVIECNQGVQGSANSGIHLNFNSHHNIISNNISNYNSIGIYLENVNTDNIISNNVCNYNYGYYGVGIELDWKCSDNIITGNTCNHNNGSAQAGESCGIQVRSGTNDINYQIKGTVVTNNKCRNNGRVGIMCRGAFTTCTGNVLVGNGYDTSHTLRSDLEIRFCDNSVFNSNTIQSLSTAKATNSIYLEKCDNISITNNNISCGSVIEDAIKCLRLKNGTINANNISFFGANNAILVTKLDTLNSSFVIVKDNNISGSKSLITIDASTTNFIKSDNMGTSGLIN